jgi:hypothetical protein
LIQYFLIFLFFFFLFNFFFFFNFFKQYFYKNFFKELSINFTNLLKNRLNYENTKKEKEKEIDFNFKYLKEKYFIKIKKKIESKFEEFMLPPNIKNREKEFFNILKDMATKGKEKQLEENEKVRKCYILKYIEFLFSLKDFESKALNDEIIDLFYHLHLLHPILFHHDCLNLFGKRIFHAIGERKIKLKTNFENLKLKNF